MKHRPHAYWMLAALAALLFAAIAASGPGTSALAAPEMAIAPRFEAVGNFHRGVAPAQEKGRWGLIGRDGRWVVPPSFASITGGGDGLFGASKGKGWNYIDPKGKTVIAGDFSAARPFENGTAAVKVGKLWGFIARNGNFDVQPKYLDIINRDGDSFSVLSAEGWVVGRKGTEVETWEQRIEVVRFEAGDWVASQPLRLYSISENGIVAAFDDGQRMMPINRTSEAPLEYKPFASLKRRSEGLAPVSTGPGKWGYLTISEDILWPGRFEDAGLFKEGLAPVKSGGKWGYITRRGDFIVEPAYDAAFQFQNGYAIVRQGELRGFLKNDPDRGVSLFIAPRYEDAFRFTEGLAPVKVGGKWGFVSNGETQSDGTVISLTPP